MGPCGADGTADGSDDPVDAGERVTREGGGGSHQRTCRKGGDIRSPVGPGT